MFEKHGGPADCSFVAGACEAWEEFVGFCRYAFLNNLVSLADGTDSLLLNAYLSCFPGAAFMRPPSWNSKVSSALKKAEDGFRIGGVLAKAIQPGLEAVNYFDLKEYSFQERHKSLHRDWHGALVKGHVPAPKVSSRRIVFHEKPRADVGERPKGAVQAAGV